MSSKGIVAVHVGAGNHSFSLRHEYKKLMKSACNEAMNILCNGGLALEAVTCATCHLEDSALTNAGYGSSLTMDGLVECDASLMDGTSCEFGAVGAVPGVPNPILLAKGILEAQRKPLLGGLVPPSFLTGNGAREWAESHDVPVCVSHDMISERSKKVHGQSLAYLNHLKEKGNRIERVEQNSDHCGAGSGLLDTVGAVAMDTDGNVAATVSSGGLLLKHSGRVGQAALYGCGCWAQNNYENSDINLAVSTTGCGEHLIKTDFGRTCARATFNTDPLGVSLSKDIKERFIDCVFLKDVPSPMGGCISLKYDPKAGTTDMFWLHTTHTMGVAYLGSGQKSPQAFFSELPSERVGRTVALNCKSFIHEEESCLRADEEDEGEDMNEEEEVMNFEERERI